MNWFVQFAVNARSNFLNGMCKIEAFLEKKPIQLYKPYTMKLMLTNLAILRFYEINFCE